jgi:hypothetical protein
MIACKYSSSTRATFYFSAKEKLIKPSHNGPPKNCMCYSGLLPFSVSERFQTAIVVTALVKEDDRGGQGHTSTSLLYQSAT